MDKGTITITQEPKGIAVELYYKGEPGSAVENVMHAINQFVSMLQQAGIDWTQHKVSLGAPQAMTMNSNN